MGDIADVVCTFCGSIMGLSREMAASANAHALQFFSCEMCGASELRIGEGNPESVPRNGRR
jgi:hypothetical protein